MNLQEQIRKVLREYWSKPKQDNTDIEEIINKVMRRNFSWFKDITIEEFSHSKIEPHKLTIYGTIVVDEEWAAERWSEVYEYREFPAKERWDEYYEPLRFEDLMTHKFATELSNFMEMLLSSVTEYTPIDYVRMGQLKVKFI